MCDAVVPGLVEILVISCFIGFFNFMNTIFGVCFVLRNKIDVPQPKQVKKYEKLYSSNLQFKAA